MSIDYQPRRDLVLSTLQRAGRPLTSEELLEPVVASALSAEWPASAIQMSRKSIGAYLRYMAQHGLVRAVGTTTDTYRKAATRYEPTGGYDPHADAPDPPREEIEDEKLELSCAQLAEVVKSQNAVIAATRRFLSELESIGTGLGVEE